MVRVKVKDEVLNSNFLQSRVVSFRKSASRAKMQLPASKLPRLRLAHLPLQISPRQLRFTSSIDHHGDIHPRAGALPPHRLRRLLHLQQGLQEAHVAYVSCHSSASQTFKILTLGFTSYNYTGKQIEPYFPSHPERNAYVTLLQMTDPPAPDSVLKAALIQRACADVRRVLRIREDKPALQALIQKGCVGDDIWEALNAAEKETETEILEVMHEANSFVMGWGGFIFNTASEIVANEQTRSLLIEKYPVMRAQAGE